MGNRSGTPAGLPDPALSIGEVARQTGLRASALRYYESVGILPPSKRVNGRRRFDPEVVRVLKTVRFAQNAGFTVSEIRTLFHGFGAHVPPSARWRQLADRKLAELDALVTRAEEMRQLLQTAMACECVRMEDCELDPEGRCRIANPRNLRRAAPGRARTQPRRARSST